MPRYNDHECDDCGVVLRSNELYRITDRVLSSVSNSTRFYRGTRGGIGGGGSSRHTYKVRQLEVCEECLKDRQARARRAAIARLIRWLFILGLGLAAAIYVANQPRSPSTDVLANDTAPVSTAETINVAEPTDTPTPEVTAASVPERSITETPPADDPALAEPTGGQALLDATKKALDEGKAVAWHERDETGFVTVSTAQDFGDKVCRNVYFTVSAHGERTRSPDRTWCQPTTGGEWTLQP